MKPMRRILSNVFYAEQGNAIARKTGVLLTHPTFIQVFSQSDLEYIPFREWEKLTEADIDDKWSVQLGATASIIVPFVIDYEFDFVASNQISNLENSFMKDIHGAMRVASIENNLRGSLRSRHISVRC